VIGREKCQREILFSRVGNVVVDQVPPTGRDADVSQVPGVGNAGLFSIVLTGTGITDPGRLMLADHLTESSIISMR
jgi:hypothetical protein